MNRVLRCFMDIDMRLGIPGLTKILEKDGYKPRDIGAGDLFVFVNRRQDRLKIMTTENTMAYRTLEGGRKVDLRVIGSIPRAFSASAKIDYDAGLKEFIISKLKAHQTKPILRKSA
jgi:hypothetical protein